MTRILGDFEPEHIPGEPDPELPETSPEPATERATAGEYADALRERRGAELDQFESVVAELVQKAAQAMQTERNAIGIDGRYARETEKYRCAEMPRLTDGGEIDQNAPNAHLKMGLTMGLFTDAVTGAVPQLVDAVVGRGDKPYSLDPTGAKTENSALGDMTEKLIDYQLDRAQWSGAMEAALRDLPRYGTTVLRQCWGVETELVPLKDEWQARKEVIAREGVMITPWPLLNVYVSHPNRRRAEDQLTVIWVSRQNLAEIERQERVLDTTWSLDGDNQAAVAVPIERGRFANLERLRREQATKLADYKATEAAAAAGLLTPDKRAAGVVEATAPYELHELQGQFPMGSLLRMGVISLEGLAWWGIKFEGENGPVEDEAAARMADRLTWYITVARPVGSTGGLPTVIEITPCRYAHPRTELLSAVYIPDGNRFYGLSADQVAGDVGDAADKTLNDIAEILDNNANPPVNVLASAFGDDIQKGKVLFQPGSVNTVRGGAISAKDASEFQLKPYDEHLPQLLSSLVDTYTTRTMVSQASKGAQAITSTGTYGEVQQQIAAGERRLADISRAAAESLVVPSVRWALEDMDWFLDRTRLAALARRVCGMAGLDADTLLPDAAGENGLNPQGLADQFIVRHAGQAAVRRELATNLLMSIADQHRDLPQLKRVPMLKQAIRTVGFNPAPYFDDETLPTSPERELEAIRAGDRPEPREDEDMLGVHLPAHEAQRQMLMMLEQQLAEQGEDTRLIGGWIKVLEWHMQRTMELAQAQMQALQQAQMQAMAQAQMQGQAPGGGPVADPENQARGMEAQATSMPGDAQMGGMA
jgi:hypothetical protein